MKKILGIVIVFLLVSVGVGVSQKNKVQQPVQNEIVIEETKKQDELALKEEDVNQFLTQLTQDKVTDLKVSFNADESVDLSFVFDEKIANLIPIKEESTLSTAMGMLDGQEVACKVSLNDDKTILVDRCIVGVLPVPSSLIDGQMEQVNAVLSSLLIDCGVEDIKIEEEQITIKGDAKAIMEKIVK